MNVGFVSMERGHLTVDAREKKREETEREGMDGWRGRGGEGGEDVRSKKKAK